MIYVSEVKLPSTAGKNVYALSEIGSGKPATLIIAADIMEAAEIAEEQTGDGRESLKWDLVLLQIGQDPIMILSDRPTRRRIKFAGLTEHSMKIPAIKRIRELTNCGLAEAKQGVENPNHYPILGTTYNVNEEQIAEEFRKYGILISLID